MKPPAIVSACLVATAIQSAAVTYEPARFLEGALPPLPETALGPFGPGEVLLEAEVGADGRVRAVNRLRVTPPYTDQVISCLDGWRFQPAIRVSESGREPIMQTVLVAGAFRPPATYLGTTVGEPPRDVGAPSGRAPILRELVFPPYPPTSRGDGSVLVEVEVGPKGETLGLKVVVSGGGYDAPALAAVRRWSFDPPKPFDGPTQSYVYAIISFRRPSVR